jgi:hypothetical protein
VVVLALRAKGEATCAPFAGVVTVMAEAARLTNIAKAARIIDKNKDLRKDISPLWFHR